MHTHKQRLQGEDAVSWSCICGINDLAKPMVILPLLLLVACHALLLTDLWEKLDPLQKPESELYCSNSPVWSVYGYLLF